MGEGATCALELAEHIAISPTRETVQYPAHLVAEPLVALTCFCSSEQA